MVGRCFACSGYKSFFILYFGFSHNSKAAASSRYEITDLYEEPISSTENNYVTEPMKNKRSEENSKKNRSDCVGNTQESEYEVGDAV